MRASLGLVVLLGLVASPAQAQTVTKLEDGRHVPYFDTALPVYTAGRVRFSEISADPRPDWCPASNSPPPSRKKKNLPPEPVLCMPPMDWTPPPMYPDFAYGWPGVYFESRFSGDEVVMRLDDAVSDLELLIDGKPVKRFSKPGEAIYEITGLKTGEHTVRLQRLSEDTKAGGSFGGFYVPTGSTWLGRETPPPAPHSAEKALTPQKRDRRIEFIGDSYLSGYGATSTKPTCSPDEIHSTTNTQLAWGALAAHYYDADYQINATSGIGVVRNYGGSSGAVMPERYDHDLMQVAVLVHSYETLTSSELTEADTVRPYGILNGSAPDTWQPQIIIVALGDNDFATPLKPGEPWTTISSLRGKFIEGYAVFLKALRERNPKATLILVDYGETELIPDLRSIAALAKARGDDRVLTWSAGTKFEQTGCDWHLNENDHKRIAAGLEAFIDSHPGIWN